MIAADEGPSLWRGEMKAISPARAMFFDCRRLPAPGPDKAPGASGSGRPNSFPAAAGLSALATLVCLRAKTFPVRHGIKEHFLYRTQVERMKS